MTPIHKAEILDSILKCLLILLYTTFAIPKNYLNSLNSSMYLFYADKSRAIKVCFKCKPRLAVGLGVM